MLEMILNINKLVLNRICNGTVDQRHCLLFVVLPPGRRAGLHRLEAGERQRLWEAVELVVWSAVAYPSITLLYLSADR